MSYRAPVEEIKFALMKEAGFGRLFDQSEYPDLSEDLLDAILEEAAKLANDFIAPASWTGDREGCQLTDDGVRVPESFKTAYSHYVSGGWPTLAAAQSHGGQGLPLSLANAVTEMMNSNIGLQLCAMLSNGGVEALSAHASAEQKDRYLTKVISGEWSATMNLTESHAGSDVGSIKAKAVPQDDGSYRITGTKIYITYGDHDMTENIIHLVLARTPNSPEGTKGISLFLVPKFHVHDDGSLGAANDVKCIGLEDKLGIHASPTCVMAFGENEGAVGWLIGAENKGMACMFTMMNNARLHVGLQGVGVAETATQKALGYALERKQGRAPQAKAGDNEAVEIIAHPDVRRNLLTMRALTDASRAICYENGVYADLAHIGADQDAKAFNDLLTPISKAFSTDIANEVAAIGVQIHGGMGFIEETGAAQHVRDARILTIYEGTNGIQAMDLIGRKLPLDNGNIVRAYIAQMRETADQCLAVNESDFQQMGRQLSAALDALDETTEWMLANLQQANMDCLSGATPYLRQFGLASGGHYLLRGALSLRAEDLTPFVQRKKTTAIFYASSLLPDCVSLVSSVKAGYETLEDIGLEAFAS